MKNSIFLTVIFFISGCSSLIPTYDQDLIESGELAEIIGTNWRDDHVYMAWVRRVYDSNGNVIADRKGGSAIDYLQIKEGSYVIVVECVRGHTYAYPAVKIDIEKSKIYSIECVVSEREQRLLGEADTKVVALIEEVGS